MLIVSLVPPVCPRRVLVGADDAAIDKMDVPIQFARCVCLLLHSFKQLLPQSTLAPVVEAP